MIPPLAYSFSYGRPPTGEEVQFRFWAFLVILALPTLAIYTTTKLLDGERAAAIYNYALFLLPLILCVLTPLPGPAPLGIPFLCVLLLCCSAELCRTGRWGLVKGCAGGCLALFLLHACIQSCFTHFMMTGRLH